MYMLYGCCVVVFSLCVWMGVWYRCCVCVQCAGVVCMCVGVCVYKTWPATSITEIIRETHEVNFNRACCMSDEKLSAFEVQILVWTHTHRHHEDCSVQVCGGGSVYVFVRMCVVWEVHARVSGHQTSARTWTQVISSPLPKATRLTTVLLALWLPHIAESV